MNSFRRYLLFCSIGLYFTRRIGIPKGVSVRFFRTENHKYKERNK